MSGGLGNFVEDSKAYKIVLRFIKYRYGIKEGLDLETGNISLLQNVQGVFRSKIFKRVCI
jgi:hypothetical protein